MENNIQNTIQDKILEKIKSGEVKMISRRFFFLKWATLAVTSIFFLILSVYIFAYVIFLFVDNGLMVIPLNSVSGNGIFSGLLKIVIEIPWTLVALGLVSLFLFSITSKTFYKIYRKPLITFYFSILMVVVLSHIIFLETGTFDFVKREAYNAGIHLVPNKFLQFRDSQTQSIYVGYVFATSSNSIIITNRFGSKQELFFENSIVNIDVLKEILLGEKINAYAVKENGKVVIKSFRIVD